MKNDRVIIGIFMLGVCLFVFGTLMESKQKSSINVEVRFKRGQSLNIEINGEQKRISLDDFVLETCYEDTDMVQQVW